MKKNYNLSLLAWTIFFMLGIAGEIQCIKKAFESEWSPISKQAVLYTASAVTGAGAIVGWFEIN